MAEEVVERDSLGEVRVPADAYYGAQTERARRNFPVSGRGVPAEVVHALGLLKSAAATANAVLGLLPAELAGAIGRAADAVAAGELDGQFVVDLYQTGSGTSTHMNANEVIAKRANELLTGRRQAKAPVHPNDHVNRGQSSNDVFPTAIHLAALLALEQDLLPALAGLQEALARKAAELDGVLKLGRTHLQDSVPVRLGQELSGYARMVERGRERVSEALPALAEVPLGGTAAGTGLNAHPQFAVRALAEVNRRTGLALRPAKDYFEALGSRHALLAASGALKTLVADLMKIANDLRLLSSGPRGGLGEIRLPALQPGSSMMPGKVNPVVPEAVCQVAARVIGNDATLTVGAASGLLELNVMMPVMADALLESVRLLAAAARLLTEKCVAGIEARPDRCRRWLDESLAMTTALAPRLGYDAAARLARRAEEEGTTLRAVAERESGLGKEELDRLLDPERMTRPEPGNGPGFAKDG
jgi:fumarate hydratase class II